MYFERVEVLERITDCGESFFALRKQACAHFAGGKLLQFGSRLQSGFAEDSERMDGVCGAGKVTHWSAWATELLHDASWDPVRRPNAQPYTRKASTSLKHLQQTRSVRGRICESFLLLVQSTKGSKRSPLSRCTIVPGRIHRQTIFNPTKSVRYRWEMDDRALLHPMV